ncbi:MAG: PilZ domain-containing protein [Gammaproteobacteria bacterium]|nr:MAG: PilZ domain-containing protein [Gammaproteobacteria bacterium]
MKSDNRQYIRHPSTIPLAFNIKHHVGNTRVTDVGEGGLCFVCQNPIKEGEHIHIKISCLQPDFDADGVVRWCCKQGNNDYLIGVAFQEQEVAYSVRMIEQICHIENYRKSVKKEQGIELSGEQAAEQWIKKYAHVFPNLAGKS